MKLIINISGEPLSQKKNDNRDYSNCAILSPYKGATTIKSKSWTAIPYSYRETEYLNKAFWIANFFIDKKIKEYHNIELVELILPNENEIEITVEDMRTPIMVHCFKDTSNYLELKKSINIWNDAKKGEIDKHIEKYKENNEKQFAKRLKRVYNSNYERVINGGNEGILYFKDDTHEKIIKESIEYSKVNEKINTYSNVRFGCNVQSAIDKIEKFYNFEIKNMTNSKVKFEFENILMPTCKIQYSMLIHSLIKQRDMKILIDDNKIENYAKYYIDDIAKTVFADIGIAFIKFEHDKDFKRNFFGIIRDNYYLGKNYKHHNCRQKIRDRRVFKNFESIKDSKFRIFHDLVMDGYKKENNACNLKELPKYGKWKFCKQGVNTVDRRWNKDGNKYLNLKKLYKDEVVECNCKKLFSKIKDEKSLDSYQYDDMLSYIHDGWEVDFGPKLIALITTTGKRNIEKSLLSIEKQTHKVNEIIIASEEEIKSDYKVHINPFESGLARNTMQALLKIKKQNSGKVYVATLDDDDEWKPDYIQNAMQLIDKKYTFITCPLEVYEEDIFQDIWHFNKKDVKVDTFLYGNCGVQGSNKIFDLDIALESGGMPKNINASTDRSFNINMLLHSDTKVSVLEEPLVIFNKDKRIDRITNNSKRLNELQKFYKHFWAMIDKSRINDINKRHKSLHGFEKVITWK